MMTVVAATQNRHKIEEIEAITKEFDINIISRQEAGVPDIEIVEDGTTFEENSYKKAFEIMKLTGMPSVADDSGLAVDALDGAPGRICKNALAIGFVKAFLWVSTVQVFLKKFQYVRMMGHKKCYTRHRDQEKLRARSFRKECRVCGSFQDRDIMRSTARTGAFCFPPIPRPRPWRS